MKSVFEALKESLIKSIHISLELAKENEQLTYQEVPSFVLEQPKEKAHGDFATNVAMLLAKPARLAPRKIAEILVENFPKNPLVEKVEIAGPGFINFYLSPQWLYPVIEQVTEQDLDYGKSDIGKGKKVQVEFVSANPTGLLHMGNARGAALGDSIATLLAASGHDVAREFYINDAGNQISKFGESLEARYLEILGREFTFPEDGYHGEDIKETMQKLVEQEGDKYVNMDSTLRREMLIEFGLKEKLSAIKAVLEKFGVEYDVWFSEQSLHDSGEVAKTIETLKEKGHLYEQEGALWFRASSFGEEKDEVLVRSNGTPTYFAADIAYHKNKFDRGFDWVINIWGADHHGHVSRMKGAMEAVGYDSSKLDVILMQLVRLYKGGEIVRMSKRSGEFVTLDDLIDEVGKEAARFFFVMRNPDSHLDFDLDLAKSQSSDNPVFYVQYAHARICSILRQAQEKGISLDQGAENSVLKAEAELDLLKKIALFPTEVAEAALALEPYRIARYSQELASIFHSFYNSCRVISEDEALSQARLNLVNAARITLRNSLALLGLTAPEKM